MLQILVNADAKTISVYLSRNVYSHSLVLVAVRGMCGSPGVTKWLGFYTSAAHRNCYGYDCMRPYSYIYRIVYTVNAR